MIVGTCGNCGGAVCTPDSWMAVTEPIPRCERCGATPKNPFGPKLEMEPAPPQKSKDPNIHLCHEARRRF